MRTTFFTYLFVLLFSLFALTAALPTESGAEPESDFVRIRRSEEAADVNDILARGEHMSAQFARADNSSASKSNEGMGCRDCGKWAGCCPKG
jgi:hypothetical protein